MSPVRCRFKSAAYVRKRRCDYHSKCNMTAYSPWPCLGSYRMQVRRNRARESGAGAMTESDLEPGRRCGRIADYGWLQRACGCAGLAHRVTGSGRGGSGQPAVAALFCLSAVRSWVAPRSPARTRREVLSQVLGQRPKLTASPGGQADPGAAYYRVIRTRVPSGIPDSRCTAAAGTRTQPLLTAWPNTDGSGQPCRPTVPGPPPKVESALE
jgi:hypothetical protein